MRAPKLLLRNQGFTLVELIITMVVAGILLTIAIPSFRDVIKSTNLTTDANVLVSSLSLARSEAVKRALPVTVCRSTNSTSPDVPGTPVPSCTTVNTSGWETGWLVFIDTNNDGTRDANEVLIKIAAPLNAGLTLRSGNNVEDYLTYLANGTSRGSVTSFTNDTFRLCDDRGNTSAYSIVINQTGRVRSDRTTTTCP